MYAMNVPLEFGIERPFLSQSTVNAASCCHSLSFYHRSNMGFFHVLVFLTCLRTVNAQTSLSNETAPPIQRIVGGFAVAAGTYPYYAKAINTNGNFFCGGTLVSPEFVLTAAHCVTGTSLAKFNIGALCNTAGNCGQYSELITIQTIFKHPQYNSNTMVNDFAVVKLSSRSTVSPLAMDPGTISPSYTQGKRNLYTTGFGTTSSGGSLSSQLLAVELAYVTQDTCSSNYPNQIFPSMMCAADPGQDSCQGDSGGPLMDADNNNILVGVVSWGNGCALPGYPGIYSRISNQITWIRDTICINHSTPKPDFCQSAKPTVKPSGPTRVPTKTPSFQPTPPFGDLIVNQNVLPFYGVSNGTYPPPGWTGLYNSVVDDSFIQIQFPFSFSIAGQSFNSAYFGSNGYATFGSGSSEYSNIGASTPSLPKILFSASDNKLYKLSYYSSNDYVSIRYVGDLYGCTSNCGRIIVEMTFFNPSVTLGFNFVEIRVGNDVSTGPFGVASANAFYAQATLKPLTSYVFRGNSDGTSWKISTNAYVALFHGSAKPSSKPTRKPTVRKPTRKPTLRKPTRKPTLFVKSKKPTKKPVSKPTKKPA